MRASHTNIRSKAKTLTKRYFTGLCCLLLATSAALPALAWPKTAGAAETVYSDAIVANINEDDQVTGAIALPFNFTYYGSTFSNIYISTNGVAMFDGPDDEYDNGDLALGDDLGNHALYPFWDDQSPNYHYLIYTKTIGDPGSRKFVMQWTNYPNYLADEYIPATTYQAILYEGSNNIQFQYKLLRYGLLGKGLSATVGISDGTNYKQFSYNETSLYEGLAIKFTPSGSSDYTMNRTATYDPVYLRTADQPTAPVLSAPTNAATDASTLPTLSWTASENTDSYYVVVSRRSDFDRASIVLHNTTEETSYTVQGEESLLPGKTYYWYVYADGANKTEVSSVRSFTTATTTHAIDDCDDLQNLTGIGTAYDTYELTANIDCGDIDNFQPINWESDYFHGTFDGQDNTISNLNMSYEDSEVALFRYTDDAVLKNVRFNGGSIAGEYYVGTLVGEAYDTSISNVSSDLDITGYGTVGGFVGYGENNDSPIVENTYENLVFTGTVSAYELAGGLIGEYDATNDQTFTITKSYTTGTVHADHWWAGGLMGAAYPGFEDYDFEEGGGMSAIIIRDCYSQADVDAEGQVGGLIGYAEPYAYGSEPNVGVTIENSYASGSVTGDYQTGGLIGVLTAEYDGTHVTIKNSFAAGPVGEGDGAVYALVGQYTIVDGEFNFDNVYFDGNRTGQTLPTSMGDTEFDGWTIVNADGSNPNYFINNHTNSPLDEWDFLHTWVTQTDDYPIFGISDSDYDNISDTEEDAAPNDGDANNDGTPDSQQANVTSFVNSITDTYATLEVDDVCSVQSVTIASEISNTTTDAGFDYPTGLMDFTIDCGTSGFTATVAQYYYGVNASELVIRKYNSVTDTYQAISGATVQQITIVSQQVAKGTYQITDGEELDEDGYANGVIVDPSGLAQGVLGAPNTGLERL